MPLHTLVNLIACLFLFSVKGNILHLLGVLAEVYPEEMLVYSDRLINLYVSTLKTEVFWPIYALFWCVVKYYINQCAMFRQA